MGTIDDDGVGIGDVDAVFDNRRGEQHIIVVVGEVENDLFEFFWLHLSMSDGHTGIRDILMDHIGNLLQLTDAVVHEIDLPIARHLEVDGISDNLCTESMYLRLNGIAVGGRCLNDAEVTSPDE